MTLEQVPSVEASQGVPSCESSQVDAMLVRVAEAFQARAGKVNVPAPPVGHNFGSRRSLGGPAFMGGTTTGRTQAPRSQA